MDRDHLDRETSVSVALTESGVKAKAKSRVIAAIDRLGGNLIELINAPMERSLNRQRAVAAGEIKLIEATVKFGVEQLNRDPEFAERAAEKYFKKVFIEQENKDAVLREALDDLRHEPPSATEAEAGDQQLDDQFMGRLEQYAEGASTDQVRQKWGRVLSAEIRKPGTFSLKVLRVIDEMEPQTAQLFEQLNTSAFTKILPKCLVGILPFDQIASLTAAGLLVEPGLTGHVHRFGTATDKSGLELWFTNLGEFAAAIPKDTQLPAGHNEIGAIVIEEGVPAIPVYVITDAGAAVAEILPNNRAQAFSRLIEKMKAALPTVQIREYDKLDDQFVLRSSQAWQSQFGYYQTHKS